MAGVSRLVEISPAGSRRPFAAWYNERGERRGKSDPSHQGVSPMRLSFRWFPSAALAVALTVPTYAQRVSEKEPAQEQGLDAAMLLTNQGVRKEIKLTEPQWDKVRAIVKGVHEKYQANLIKAKKDKNEKKFVQLIQDSTRETADKVGKALPDILRSEQLKRLKQIEIQVNGLFALNKPDVQKQLKLSDTQKSRLKSIGDGLKQDVGEVFKAASKTKAKSAEEASRQAAESGRTVQRLSDEAFKKALAVLTESQKKTWKDLTGPKFEFKFDAPKRPSDKPPSAAKP
jgi:hypothetical protein